MRRFLAGLLAALMVLSLCACGAADAPGKTDGQTAAVSWDELVFDRTITDVDGEGERHYTYVYRVYDTLEQTMTHVAVELPEQDGIEDIGGTLRLGSYPCVLDKSSLAYKLYAEETIHERHRHRYEFNNDYRKVLTENGMMLSGISPDGRIVEMVELPDHPFFIGTQAHPELKSRPNRPHPLFRGFVEAAVAKHEAE